MNVERIAAFSAEGKGGNPAGVVLMKNALGTKEMQKIAADVGYSETAFAYKQEDGAWRVRYFAPEIEVPFCGHATIALGVALAKEYGSGTFDLKLNDNQISVDGFDDESGTSAALKSPETQVFDKFNCSIGAELCDLFAVSKDDFNLDIWPAFINAGANHLVMALKDRDQLANMAYDFDEGREFMKRHDLVTIMLVYVEGDQIFHVRNAFASGGILEDPATGAAAAAFAGYLRHIKWPHNNSIEIIQGEDMGSKSVINVEFTDEPGSPVTVSGSARIIEDETIYA